MEAKEEGQKYKVGKYILETKRIRIGVSWEGGDEGGCEEERALPMEVIRGMSDGRGSRGPSPSRRKGGDIGIYDGEVEFDSDNDEECEDLFAGVWSPQLAKKRRQRRKERVERKILREKEKYANGAYRSSTETLCSGV